MKALKICAQVILICLLFSLPTFANAELQGRLFGDDVVTANGESFNIGELNKSLNDGNINAAESIYNDFVKRREQMLKRGTEFGIFDLYIKYCHARILYNKKDYEGCIAAIDEILDYPRDHLNDGNKKNSNWIYLIYNSLRFKRFSYDELKDYANSLKVQNDIVNFLESQFSSDNQNLLKEKMYLSTCYWRIKDFQTAIEKCEELIPQFEKVFGEKSAELRDLRGSLAFIYQWILRYSEAVKLYEEILRYDIEVYGENDVNTLQSYDNLIKVYFSFRQYEKMGDLLNRAVPIAENLPDDSDLKYNIFERQALYYGHTRQFQKELEIDARLLNMPISNKNKIRVLSDMAETYRCLYDYSNALKYILQAWDIYEKNLPEDKWVRANILKWMSAIYSDIGNNQEAVRYAQEAYDLVVEIAGLECDSVFIARDNLADCYDRIRQHDKALELYKENYDLAVILNGKDNPLLIGIMDKIGHQYYRLGDYESGITWAKKAVDESVRILGEKDVETLYCQNALAILYEINNNTLDEAIKLYEKVLGTFNEIVSEQDTNIDIVMNNLARAYNKASRLKEAIPLYEKVIERMENRVDNYGALTSDEKQNIFLQETLICTNAALLYYRDNNFKAAFKTFERGRSRLLIDYYAEQIIKSSGVLNKQEIAKLNEYKAGLADYAKQIDAAFKAGDEQARFNLENEQRNLSDEYVKYKDFLKNKYPKYKTISQANNIDLERDKNILPADTAFIEFVSDGKILMPFVFDNSGDVKAVVFNVSENFFEKCNLYHELLSYPDLETMQSSNAFLYQFPDGSYKVTFGANIKRGSGAERVKDNETFLFLKKNLAKALGDVLLAPIAEYISKYPHLIISPDQDLNNIPFETLEFNGKPAIETFNMSYVPSFSVLKLMYEAGEKNSKLTNRQDLYAMGNPFYGNNDADAAHRSLENFFRGQHGEIAVNQFRNLSWSNLPYTKEELNRVSEIFSSKKIFSEKSASETNLKASNQRDELAKYKYILFSTHGLFVPYAPEYNSIVLSQGVDTKEDGYVTVGEWAGMNLNSDVVFLSACETGLGEYQAGEGIIGIPYALTIAGNKNTVMSLWKVYDAYTPEFVATFFKKMKEGKPAFIAINETKREFLKSSTEMQRDPSVWSAFVLYGF